MIRVLFIDDDPQAQKTLAMVLAGGYAVSSALTAAAGLDRTRAERPDVVLLDVDLPDGSGLDLLDAILALPDPPPVIMLTAYGDLELVKRAIQAGARDYILKPYSLSLLEGALARAVRHAELSRRVAPPGGREALDSLVGESPAMAGLRAQLLRYASADCPVLIQGESGTGKELVARALHELSPRRQGPFLAVNCAAVPETVLESELFGSEKGAFTDAVSRPGWFERARSGTLFLDEIGEMSLAAQAKLLRVLESSELYRVGGRDPVRVDVRILSASNRSLLAAVRAGSFREDLFYRLNVLPVSLPPLRERKEDIPLLVAWFMNRLSPATVRVEEQALVRLQEHDWPGNVRELRNVVERGLVLAQDGTIRRRDILIEAG
ncbi:MAG: sigma-54-dependent Fis family transcriptional regulator [Spirochaetales bacterium]|nr:sigma-54-dependent Fis family transcriptional regulator [Spirochaetales bacterium]